MVKINEMKQIRAILERAGDIISSSRIASGYAATVIETTSGDPMFPESNIFEGTILYFPGVRAVDLVRGPL